MIHLFIYYYIDVNNVLLVKYVVEMEHVECTTRVPS